MMLRQKKFLMLRAADFNAVTSRAPDAMLQEMTRLRAS